MKSLHENEYVIVHEGEVKLTGGTLLFKTFYPVSNRLEDIDSITSGLDFLGLFDSIK